MGSSQLSDPMNGHLMDTKAALGAAVGLTLTVAGAVSALLLTVGPLDQPAATSEPAPVVIEYVDQAGNPVADPQASTQTTPEILLVYPDGTVVDAAVPQQETSVIAPAEAVATEVTYEAPAEYEEAQEYEEEEDDDYEEDDD